MANDNDNSLPLGPGIISGKSAVPNAPIVPTGSAGDWHSDDDAAATLLSRLVRPATSSAPAFDATGKPLAQPAGLVQPQGQPLAPAPSMKNQILTALAQAVIGGLRTYGETRQAIEDPRGAIERRGQDVQMAEAMARLQEAAAPSRYSRPASAIDRRARSLQPRPTWERTATFVGLSHSNVAAHHRRACCQGLRAEL